MSNRNRYAVEFRVVDSGAEWVTEDVVESDGAANDLITFLQTEDADVNELGLYEYRVTTVLEAL